MNCEVFIFLTKNIFKPFFFFKNGYNDKAFDMEQQTAILEYNKRHCVCLSVLDKVRTILFVASHWVLLKGPPLLIRKCMHVKGVQIH